MDKSQEQPKKCFCARCFLPIDPEDKVDVEGQNFHRLCSMCCICRTIPTSLKMFYGHVFCSECFKTHVMARFKGEAPRMHSNSWWMQWAPGAKQEEKDKTEADSKDSSNPPPEEPARRCICARCLQAVSDNNKIDIGGQSFHTQCARCYFCHAVPKNSVKIYYGQVFCEECFHKHVLNRGRDNPSEFFKNCFEQWQNNATFAENMRQFMAGNKEATPFVFMMTGGQPPFCRCGAPEYQQPEARKSATPALSVGSESLGTWDLSFENRTDASDAQESTESAAETTAAAEKIEKLTKYLHCTSENEKKWQSVQKVNGVGCPKCLWQCGVVFVRDCRKAVCCGDC
ncbi:uncharacterized protein LOC135085782 isoform X1 [Ostrinia nubilalis]|uniref:uncharacterized protein LOC135085782 isoform X1 n=1 Tax=Ostrinia nubilalis TaxID=29057 RepID=UPI00308233E4